MTRSCAVGLIPAHAGKTFEQARVVQLGGAHPRSRGENWPQLGIAVRGEGSSPLTRGKQNLWKVGITRTGLIPAHAGKTSPHDATAPQARAHPRSRGEN